MKLTFNGAAQIVTGSCYLLEAAKEKILIDCGIFQGTKDITRLNYEPFRFNPKEISYLLLTHAHIDHSGLIPKLVKEGFKGKIIATPPTVDLAKIMLEDSARINEDDTILENKRRIRSGLEPRNPLYTLKDAKASFPLFKSLGYDTFHTINDTFRMIFRNAGHILGSAIIELWVTENKKTKKIVFSGDLGQWNTPIVSDPTMIEEADFVLVESTYGDRTHGEPGIRGDVLLKEVKDTFNARGKLMIPSFAVERTQELLFYLHQEIRDGKFPSQKIFLDSPLAIAVTEIFKRHMSYASPKLKQEFVNPFTFKQLQYLKTPNESRRMNDYNEPCIIIAGSGMCNAGRIRHHLKHNLWNPKNTLLFVGYQAEGTLGRVILDGAEVVKMMGIEVAVEAKVKKIDSFSSHADGEELIRWVNGFKNKPKVFVVHGEVSSTEALSTSLGNIGFKTNIPKHGDIVELI